MANDDDMGNAMSENLQYVTVCMEDDVGAIVGTGFLTGDTPVSQDERGNQKASWLAPSNRGYLVTARHVLGKTRSEIFATHSIFLRYNTLRHGGLTMARAEFEIENDPPNWAIHPDDQIDVAVLDVTNWLKSLDDPLIRFCPLSELGNAVNLAATHCDAGDDAYVLGYPLKLRQGKSNLPVVRKGVLATSPRRPLAEDDGAILRGFLIDGAILPGSSGSPVVSTSHRYFAGDLELTSNRPLIIGVVSQEWGRGKLQRYETAASADVPIEGYANLGFAHSASTIIETIAELGHHDERSCLQFDHDHNWAAQTGIPEWALESDSVDGESIDRITRRLYRDRLRKTGQEVPDSDWHDAVDILGAANPASNREPS